MPRERTKTKRFGSGRRESHDASFFYGRKAQPKVKTTKGEASYTGDMGWSNRIYCADARDMSQVPDNSVGLTFTSPPYNVGKDYDDDLAMHEYLNLLREIGREVQRVLVSGGRYVINLAGVGRKPYVPLQAHTQLLMSDIGFLPMGEIIWYKAVTARGNCAWGSWRSAKTPVLRDIHEYLLVFGKDSFGRPDKGNSTIDAEEFMKATTSVWAIQPAHAKQIGHPAPFPVALAERVIRLYSYESDTILDPFCGSGTTCVAAKRLGRNYVGYDISSAYCELAHNRLKATSGPIVSEL